MRSNSEATLNLSQEFKEDFLMSKISADVKATGTKARKDTEIHTSEIKTNFMGGESYVVDPIMTMKMMTASAIFGEPSYYMGSSLVNKESYAERRSVKAEQQSLVSICCSSGISLARLVMWFLLWRLPSTML